MTRLPVAGGVLWPQGPRGLRLALVHRPSHADWSLPKGKVDDVESWRSADVREAAEETGCHARITGFAGAKRYVEREVPELVLYWHMWVVLVLDGRRTEQEPGPFLRLIERTDDLSGSSRRTGAAAPRSVRR